MVLLAGPHHALRELPFDAHCARRGGGLPAASFLVRVLIWCWVASFGAGVVEVHAQATDEKQVFDTVIRRNQGPGASGDAAGAAAAEASPQPAGAIAARPGTAGEGQTSATGGAGEGESSKRQGRLSDSMPSGTATGEASKPAPNKPPTQSVATATGGGPVTVNGADLSTSGDKTRFELTLSAGVRAEIFTLANPYRVIIDLPDVDFRLPDGTGTAGTGLISAYRYGLFADHKGRIVLDAAGPVRIDGARMTTITGGPQVKLEMDLIGITAGEFGQGTGAASAPQPAVRPTVFDDPMKSSGKEGEGEKPLVLIDPGHGGVDPGAVGVSNILEKAVVLDVARRLERRLRATGRYRVALTRTRDVFLSLDQRVDMSRELKADLFISLHADALDSATYAPVVRGATVYTLSERASDEQARQMAEKENASDAVAGIGGPGLGEQPEVVRNILIDLMKREMSNFSTDFSNLLVARLKEKVSLSRDPQRSAAFRVLKQSHAPSVLVELGYLSNDADATLMRQGEWQGKVAHSIVAAINAYFDKRLARSGR